MATVDSQIPLGNRDCKVLMNFAADRPSNLLIHTNLASIWFSLQRHVRHRKTPAAASVKFNA